MKYFRQLFSFLLGSLLRRSYLTPCYSQEGEDIILQRLFSPTYRGFYVDIGAHHPQRFSNTYLLYRNGWHGINADAMPGSMAEFRRWRPRDINIEAGISGQKGILKYHIFQEPALNTFDPSLAEKYIRDGFPVISMKEIALIDVNSLLAKYLPSGRSIDVLSIDIEGLDELVLENYNYSLYKPKVIICENFSRSIEKLFKSKHYNFLCNLGFSLYSKLINSCIWVDNSFFQELLRTKL